ncbi:hypothetical protein KFU94_01455 [Chloroflexi bacterium TSY]|nr:hypothetical protein [Chloroflexi bacterium TSY]
MSHSLEGMGYVWTGKQFLDNVEYILNPQAHIGTLVVDDQVDGEVSMQGLTLYLQDQQPVRFSVSYRCIVKPQVFYRIQLDPL